MTELVSVVVPAYNAGATIADQLRALAAQQLPGPFEVIVADNGSTDDTVAVVERCGAEFSAVRLVDASGRRGPAHARNVGFGAARGDLVLGCDADDVVDERWAALLVDSLADADLVAGGASAWLPVAGEGPPFGIHVPHDMGTGGLGFLPVMAGSSFGVRREVWQTVGGFDVDLPTTEDFDFAFRAQLAGFRFAACPAASVHYRLPASTAAGMRKYYDYGRFQPLLYRRHRANGMRRRDAAEVARVWLRLAARSPELFGTRIERRRWCERFAHACGRIAGSIEFRTLFP
jgi:glycosyltransferase involved in cell wall biosynthesis